MIDFFLTNQTTDRMKEKKKVQSASKIAVMHILLVAENTSPLMPTDKRF